MTPIKIKFGKTVIELAISENMSVEHAKIELSREHHLRVETIRLIVQGRVLDNSELLYGYINSTITMVSSSLDQKIEDDTPRHMRTRLIDDLTQAPKEYKAKL